jgi:hypothetical protein
MSPEELESRVWELEARVEAVDAALRVMIEHMERCPERGGPLSWRCVGTGRLVGHGKRCTEGHRL